MKKIWFITAAILFAGVSYANPNAAPPIINQQTLAAMLQIQQQQTQLQQQLVNIQQTLLMLQKQQLTLQHNLFMSITQPISADFKWISMLPVSNSIPANRINAGLTNGPAVYICHVQYKNLGVHPGTVTATGCLISYAGKAYTETNYQVLTGTGKVSWQPSSSMQSFRRPMTIFDGPGPVIPSGLNAQNGFQSSTGNLPIIGGSQQGQNLYICRAIVDNAVHVGKVVSNNCNVGYEGKELIERDFQVLFAG